MLFHLYLTCVGHFMTQLSSVSNWRRGADAPPLCQAYLVAVFTQRLSVIHYLCSAHTEITLLAFTWLFNRPSRKSIQHFLSTAKCNWNAREMAMSVYQRVYGHLKCNYFIEIFICIQSVLFWIHFGLFVAWNMWINCILEQPFCHGDILLYFHLIAFQSGTQKYAVICMCAVRWSGIAH